MDRYCLMKIFSGFINQEQLHIYFHVFKVKLQPAFKVIGNLDVKWLQVNTAAQTASYSVWRFPFVFVVETDKLSLFV